MLSVTDQVILTKLAIALSTCNCAMAPYCHYVVLRSLGPEQIGVYVVIVRQAASNTFPIFYYYIL
jgi:hypothetical protein